MAKLIDGKELTVESFGWNRVPDLKTEDGRMVYRTIHTLPVLYALSRHGWDMEMISEREFEKIVEQAMDARKVSSCLTPSEHPLEQPMREALDILRQMFGPLPGRQR